MIPVSLSRPLALLSVLALFLLPFGHVRAQSPCQEVRIATVGWLDAGAAAASASALLSGLGYKATLQRLSVPVIFASMKNDDVDLFLEVMVPTMGADLKPYLLDDSVQLLRKNLSGTKYSLAVNRSGAELGIRDVKDIVAHSKALDFQIHSIEANSDGTHLIQRLINDPSQGLQKFSITTGSEDDLMGRLGAAAKSKSPMVFLAWEPHPMNVRFSPTWLTGGDSVFGENFGGADVYTGIRSSMLGQCPNIEKLFNNLEFSLDMSNEIMTAILNLNASPLVAAVAWMRQQPSVLEKWLNGVTTVDGKPGLAAVRSFIGLEN